jgi:effector-binding domain-containing protein
MVGMGERDPHLMSIGRFSEATRLSVKALRLYDDMGLLVPEHVDESNGYRYYGPSQTARAEAIRLLRNVDMPLEEIGQLLNSTPAKRDELMARHLERLHLSLTSQEKKLTAFADLAEGRRHLMPYEVTKKEVPPTRVAMVEAEVDLASIEVAFRDGFGEILSVLAPAGAAPTGAPFVIYHDVIDESMSGRIEMCLPVDGEFQPTDRVKLKELPHGSAASTIHKGSYEEIPPAYHAVSEWMTANGYEPAGPPCEVYLNDPREVPVSEQLTEVLWGIREVSQ